MVDHNHLIPNEDRAILGTLRGKTLENIEGYRYDLALSEEKTTFYSVARLHMEDGSAYDLRLRLVRVDITGDSWDDVGTYAFGRAEGDIWLPEGVAAFKLPIHRKIDEVILVNDYDELMHGDVKESSFAFTKAVLLRTGLEYIALAIDDFGEDVIVVRRGFDSEKLVPDGSGSWYDEPSWTD
ncbi:hypothetical protein [Collinsella vaginalis]|uniref:hypothetical protein n=1 Tax=Collinsella vaginalis TaxID=1870987 RepID=UPI000A26DDFC|nr:hypothetical protein [Collinsella vaginalis]